MNAANVQTVIDLPDLDATQAFGRRLAGLLFPGAVVALVGPLGAGKTHLVRAVAEGLGVRDSRVVTSPTFVLIQEYEARLPIYHFDAYRLRGDAEFAELGAHYVGYRPPYRTLADRGDIVDHVIEHAMTLRADLVPILRIERLARHRTRRGFARRVAHAARSREIPTRRSSMAANAPKILRICGGL